mgnify:CR=1 FL=1
MRLVLSAQTTAGDLLLTDGDALDLGDRVALPGLGVEGDTGEALAWLSDSPVERSIRVQVLAAGGLELDGRAELSRVPEGGTWRDRQVIAAGRLDELQADETSWSASIVEDPYDDRGLLLEEGAAVGPLTWPRTDAQRAADGWPAYSTSPATRSTRIEGAPYPVVIGCPAGDVTITPGGLLWTGSLPGSPGLYVELTSSTTQIDDHVILLSCPPVTATHVEWAVVGSGSTGSHREPVVLGHDGQGRAVSLLSPGGSGSIPADDDAEIWIAWTAADGGGIADPYGPGMLRRADHVIRWALERSTLRIDRRQMARLSALSAIQIDTAITAQVVPWAWLRSEVLPLLPVSVCSGPDGLYLYPWHIASRAAAVGRLEVELDCERLTPYTRARLDPVTRLSVLYALDARAGRPAMRWTVAGRRRPTDIGDGAVGLDYWAARAYTVHGERAEEITAAVVTDTASAQQIATWRVRAACTPSWSVQVQVPGDTEYRPGDVLRLVDVSMGLDVAVQVSAVVYTAGASVIDLRHWASSGATE